MSRSVCCGCVMAFSAACQRHMMVQFCHDIGSINNLFCMCFLPRQEANDEHIGRLARMSVSG